MGTELTPDDDLRSISVSPTLLDFGIDSMTLQVVITNTNKQPLLWHVDTGGASWLIVEPKEGSLQPGGQQTVNVIVNRSSLLPGNYLTTLSVNSKRMIEPTTIGQQIEVKLNVLGQPREGKTSETASMLRIQPTEDRQGLELINTPLINSKSLRVLNSITPLRNLYDINVSVYRAALDAWTEDFLGFCQTLDTLGVSTRIVDYGKNQLQEDFSFSDFLLKNVNKGFVFQRFFQLLAEWGVPLEKRNSFFDDMDETVDNFLATPLPNNQFFIEPTFRRVFSMLDQEDAFKDWEHLAFKWKVFGSSALIPLGTLVGAVTLVPFTPIVLAGASVGAVLILVGAALAAMQ